MLRVQKSRNGLENISATEKYLSCMIKWTSIESYIQIPSQQPWCFLQNRSYASTQSKALHTREDWNHYRQAGDWRSGSTMALRVQRACGRLPLPGAPAPEEPMPLARHLQAQFFKIIKNTFKTEQAHSWRSNNTQLHNEWMNGSLKKLRNNSKKGLRCK